MYTEEKIIYDSLLNIVKNDNIEELRKYLLSFVKPVYKNNEIKEKIENLEEFDYEAKTIVEDIYSILINNKSSKLFNYLRNLKASEWIYDYSISGSTLNIKQYYNINKENGLFIFDNIYEDLVKEKNLKHHLMQTKFIEKIIENEDYSFLSRLFTLANMKMTRNDSEDFSFGHYLLYKKALNDRNRKVIEIFEESKIFKDRLNYNIFLYDCFTNNIKNINYSLKEAIKEEIKEKSDIKPPFGPKWIYDLINNRITITRLLNKSLSIALGNHHIELFKKILNNKRSLYIRLNRKKLHDYLIESIESNFEELTYYLLDKRIGFRFTPVGEVWSQLRPKQKRGDPEPQIIMGCFGGPTYSEAVGNDCNDVLTFAFEKENLNIIKHCFNNKKIWKRIDDVYKERLFDQSVYHYDTHKNFYDYLITETDTRSYLNNGHLVRVFIQSFIYKNNGIELPIRLLNDFDISFNLDNLKDILQEIEYELTERGWKNTDAFIQGRQNEIDIAYEFLTKANLNNQLEKELIAHNNIKKINKI